MFCTGHRVFFFTVVAKGTYDAEGLFRVGRFLIFLTPNAAPALPPSFVPPQWPLPIDIEREESLDKEGSEVCRARVCSLCSYMAFRLLYLEEFLGKVSAKL